MKEKTYVEDIDRNIYDFKDDEKDAYKIKAGLTPEIVEQLSKEKHDPRSYEHFDVCLVIQTLCLQTLPFDYHNLQVVFISRNIIEFSGRDSPSHRNISPESNVSIVYKISFVSR